MKARFSSRTPCCLDSISAELTLTAETEVEATFLEAAFKHSVEFVDSELITSGVDKTLNVRYRAKSGQ